MSVQGQYTQIGALFANHILQLGEEGFAKWLTDSFGGPEIKIDPGYFQYDGPSAPDVNFDEMMCMVINEFEGDVLRVGAKAASIARARMNPETSSAGRVILGSIDVLFNPLG